MRRRLIPQLPLYSRVYNLSPPEVYALTPDERASYEADHRRLQRQAAARSR